MRRIQIYDTTLRDGTQGEGVSFSLQDKLQITQRLDEIGVDYIEGGYPLSNEKDAEYFQRVRQLRPEARQGLRLRHDPPQGRHGRRRPGHEGPARVRRPRCCTMVGKTWDFHVAEVLRVTLGREPGDDRRQRRASWRRPAAR